MYCKNCGQEIDDRAVFCPHCGVATDNLQNYGQPPQPAANRGLVTAAKVFIVIGIILSAYNMFSSVSDIVYEYTYPGGYDAFYLIIYIIELTVSVIELVGGIIFGVLALKKINLGLKPSTAVCVCVLIFTNLIAGILLLCTKDKDYM